VRRSTLRALGSIGTEICLLKEYSLAQTSFWGSTGCAYLHKTGGASKKRQRRRPGAPFKLRLDGDFHSVLGTENCPWCPACS
jgi:hypothetical protein